MGYYTRFTFVDTPEPAIERLREVSGYSFDDTHKWYDHEDDIKRVSKEFLGKLITVQGEGEESGDLWVLYALNGVIQRHKAEIVYPPHNFTLPKKITKNIAVAVGGATVYAEVTLPESATEQQWEDEARRIIRESI